MVAPRNESIRDPIPPAVAPHKSNGINSETQFCLQTAFSIASVMARVRPMTNPPARDARDPRVDKPPLVPGGTGLNVVIKIGGDLDNMPNSDANVSPKQQAKWPRDARSMALLNPDVTCGDRGHQSVEEYGRPGMTNKLGNNWDANEFGTKAADQRSVARRAEKELQYTCVALLYPASWCPSSNSALRRFPTLVAREPTR
jgi:hypothetical protein